jgi:hypothetical protein
MQIIRASDLEHLIRETFPEKLQFSAEAELGVDLHRRPVVTFVHGGPDPFLDRQFEDWLQGATVFVAAHQLLNRLCRAGALAPGQYALTRALDPTPEAGCLPASPGANPAAIREVEDQCVRVGARQGQRGEMQR